MDWIPLVVEELPSLSRPNKAYAVGTKSRPLRQMAITKDVKK